MESRQHFPAFPFEPYPVQLHFMKEVYGALQNGGVVIAESPTGTGKTLSLICSVLQWLEDQRLSTFREQEEEPPLSKCSSDLDSEPDWLRDFCKPNIKKDAAKTIKRAVFRSKILNFSGPKLDMTNLPKKKTVLLQDLEQSLDEFVLDDYDSNDEFGSGKNDRKRKTSNITEGSSDEDDVSEDDEDEKPVKVLFCSRTHSQLSQFVKELQRTVFSKSFKAVTLGSRKSLCINPDVQKLGHPARINERCLELQRNSNKKSSGNKAKMSGENKGKGAGCPFIRSRELLRNFKDCAWESEVLDIEDLVQLGHGLGTCPYYGSRRMIRPADLVILPYQSLLHHATRESLGLKMNDCIVIIDEAHNLVDSIGSMYSCQISDFQLQQVQKMLSMYLGKFREKLSAGNRRYIQTLLVLIEAFLDRLVATESCGDDSKGLKQETERVEILTINDFLFSLDIDNVNMFKLWHYMKNSKIIHKVCGYAENSSFGNESFTWASKDEVQNSWSGAFTSFHVLAELVLALMTADTDGRIIVHSSFTSRQGQTTQAFIKFVMLNAAQAFSEVVETCHAVVLAGGTLQPIEELQCRLYPQLPRNQVHFFSCGHIVPPENVLALAVAHGPTGRSFDFTYQSRSLPEMIEELGRLLYNLSLVVPEGMVVFLPSFEYEQQLHSAWKKSGILEKIQKKKFLFREPKDSASVDITLQKYKETVEKADNLDPGTTGAIILCVVGGKMSEGINFSDGMGRCVVMVGLPYPSIFDPELVERMKHIDMMKSISFDDISEGRLVHGRNYSGRDYYENLCMKAVNQSIGRAIRHIRDYAAIVLVDARYTAGTSGPASKLPTWIREQLVIVTGGFGEVHRRIHQFFRKKQGEK